MTREQPIGTSRKKTAPAVDRQFAGLTVDVCTDHNEFPALRRAWEGLALAPGCSVFQSYDWLTLWWKHYGAQQRNLPYVISFRCGDEVVGIAPMFIDTVALFGVPVYRRLAMLGSGTSFFESGGASLDNGPSDYLDILVKPGFEPEVSKAFWEFIDSRRDLFDEIEFLNSTDSGFVHKHLMPAAPDNGSVVNATRADVCPRLNVASSFEEYLLSLHGSTRRRLIQARRASTEPSSFRIRSVTSPSEFRHALHQIIEIHQKRWNRLGYPGLFFEDRFRVFLEDVLESFFANGLLWCRTAVMEGNVVAGRLGFKDGNRFYDYLSGFDDELQVAKRRPGLALIIEMLEDAIRDRAESIDFLRGDEQYKFDFTSDVRHNWNWVVRQVHPQGMTRKVLLRLLRALTFTGFALRREYRLLKVQFHTRSWYSFLFTYVRFRSPSVRRKMASLLGTSVSANRGRDAGGKSHEWTTKN